MELIALLLLAPLIWSSDPAPAAVPLAAHAEVHEVDGVFQIRPPDDESLTMTVIEHRPSNDGLRGPASVALRRIDVIVTAP